VSPVNAVAVGVGHTVELRVENDGAVGYGYGETPDAGVGVVL